MSLFLSHISPLWMMEFASQWMNSLPTRERVGILQLAYTAWSAQKVVSSIFAKENFQPDFILLIIFSKTFSSSAGFIARIVGVSGISRFHSSAHGSSWVASIRGSGTSARFMGSICRLSVVILGTLVSLLETDGTLSISSDFSKAPAQAVSDDFDASSTSLSFSLSFIRRSAMVRT